MATARPFAYNTGSTIDGTIQIGDLAVGTPTTGFTGSMEWWNGADEDLGYVVAGSVPDDTQPAPDGRTASVQFWRSVVKNQSSFIELANYITGQSFTSASDASLYLYSQGYWNSYPCPSELLSGGSLNGYFKFNNGLGDSSGNNLQVVNFGVNFGSGRFNQASLWNGTSNRIFITKNSLLSGTGGLLSVFLWFNITDFNSWTTQTPIDYYDATTQTGYDIRVSYIDSNSWKMIIRVGTDTLSYTFSTGFKTNSWHHIGFTYNNTNNGLYGYFDGSLVSQTGTANQNLTPTNKSGCFVATTLLTTTQRIDYLKGYIDELAFWGRVLSPDEVYTLYYSNCPIKQ